MSEGVKTIYRLLAKGYSMVKVDLVYQTRIYRLYVIKFAKGTEIFTSSIFLGED